MTGVEVVPCVCRTCRAIVSVEHDRNPQDATGEPSLTVGHIRSIEQPLGVESNPPVVCPDCGGAVQALLGQSGDFDTPVIVGPCPRCGQALTEAPGGFEILWD